MKRSPVMLARPLRWREVSPALLRSAGPEFARHHVHQSDVDDGHLSVFVGVEAGRWHLSISHRRLTRGVPQPGRYPTWDEIADARYRFMPDTITAAMLLPPPDQYVNLHDTTFHLHEIGP